MWKHLAPWSWDTFFSSKALRDFKRRVIKNASKAHVRCERFARGESLQLLKDALKRSEDAQQAFAQIPEAQTSKKTKKNEKKNEKKDP